MKNLVLSLAIGIIAITFAGCDKSRNDVKNLAGTTWKATTYVANFELHFIGDSICAIIRTRNDGSHSTNLTTYSYCLSTACDSRSGDFFMTEQYGDGIYIGYIKKKTIELVPVMEGKGTYLVFKKQKK